MFLPNINPKESVNVKSVLYDITRERCCCKPGGQMLALPCWLLATCYLLKRLRGRFEESKKQWKSMRFTARRSFVADGWGVVLKREGVGWVGRWVGRGVRRAGLSRGQACAVTTAPALGP